MKGLKFSLHDVLPTKQAKSLEEMAADFQKEHLWQEAEAARKRQQIAARVRALRRIGILPQQARTQK